MRPSAYPYGWGSPHWRSILLSLTLSVSVACEERENLPPSITPLEEQQLEVNRPWSVELFAADPEGELLQFAFTIDPPIGTPTEGDTARPRLQPLNREKALLQWTPGYGDVGRYTLTVRVQDPEGASAEESFQLQVNTSTNTIGVAPRFIAPRGAGLIHDLSRAPCIDGLPVEVRADAIPDEELLIELIPEPPLGLTLSPPPQLPGKRRTLSWCPPPELLAESNRIPVTFQARRRGEPGGAEKRFLFTFLQEAAADCPGRAPILSHQAPERLSGIQDYALRFQVQDDLGLKSPPLLAYLLNPASDPRQLPPGSMLPWELVEASAEGGDLWVARVPNPGLAPGERGRLFYYLVAVDNDDPEGARCDHGVESPIYDVPLEGAVAEGGLASCSPCSNHLQCGGEADLCLSLLDGDHCGVACAPDGACPQGLSCFLIGGEEEGLPPQCLPESQRCVAECSGDRFDGGETPTLADGFYEDLELCPGDEVDFYWVQSGAGERFSAAIRFQDAVGDLDLYLSTQDEVDGTPLFDYVSAEAGRDEERIELPCYDEESDLLLAVVPFEGASNRYQLQIESIPCELCVDDPLEPLEEERGSIDEEDALGPLILCPGDLDQVELLLEDNAVLSVYLSGSPEARGLLLTLLGPAGEPVATSISIGDRDAFMEYRPLITGRYLLLVSGADPGSGGGYLLNIDRLETPACEETRDCALGAYCVRSLGCFDERCGADYGCAAEHRCLGPTSVDGAPAAGEGRCHFACTGDIDCRPGERCKQLHDFDRRCIVEGPGLLGSECSSHDECAGAAACLETERETRCLLGGCSERDPCPEEFRCARLSGGSSCVPND